MVDFVEDFLKEATFQLSGSESLQSILTEEAVQQESWDSLYSFFDFVRSVSPFAGFMRLYRLSDAAIREMRENKTREALSSALKKFQRVKDILLSVGEDKKETDGSDEDLLFDKEEEQQNIFNQIYFT